VISARSGCRIKSGMTKSDFLRDHQISNSKFDSAELVAGQINPKSQNSNSKWFDKPFDKLTVLSKVEGLTTLSQPVESLKVERVEGQISTDLVE
jgi:hypothetical protein